jgi:hypothetical protein
MCVLCARMLLSTYVDADYEMQVECHPAGPIVVKIKGYRAAAGGFVSMTFGNVAGRGTFTAVDLRTSPQAG